MSIHTFTLCRRLSGETWRMVKKRVYEAKNDKRNKNRNYKVYEDKGHGSGTHIVDERFKGDGVIFVLHQYPILIDEPSLTFYSNYSLTIRVNPSILVYDRSYIDIFDLTEDRIAALISKINLCLADLGHYIPDSSCMFGLRPFRFDDFHFQRIDLSGNLELPSYEMAQQVMELIQKCRVPKGFKRYPKNRNSVMIYCRSVAVTAYLKNAQMETQSQINYSSRDIDRCSNLIRIEVHCMVGKIQGLTNSMNEKGISPTQILSLLMDDSHYFNYLDKVFLKGDYRAYHDTVNIITSSPLKNKTKDKLLEIVTWTNQISGSLEMALQKYKKKYGDSDAKPLGLLKKFDELNVNPVTLSRNTKVNTYLPSISRLLTMDVII